MRRIPTFLLAAILLFTACNNKPKETTVTDSRDGKETVILDSSEVKNDIEELEKQKKDLEKLTPLSLDQLKDLVPETLMGAKRTNIEVNSVMGTGLAAGDYELNDSTRYSLNIYDCGGPAGAGIYSMQFMSLLNAQQENDEEYTKTIDINGSKAYEHCEKATTNCIVTFFSGGRFLVTLEGDQIGADALIRAASGLNIK